MDILCAAAEFGNAAPRAPAPGASAREIAAAHRRVCVRAPRAHAGGVRGHASEKRARARRRAPRNNAPTREFSFVV